MMDLFSDKLFHQLEKATSVWEGIALVDKWLRFAHARDRSPISALPKMEKPLLMISPPDIITIQEGITHKFNIINTKGMKLGGPVTDRVFFYLLDWPTTLTRLQFNARLRGLVLAFQTLPTLRHWPRDGKTTPPGCKDRGWYLQTQPRKFELLLADDVQTTSMTFIGYNIWLEGDQLCYEETKELINARMDQ